MDGTFSRSVSITLLPPVYHLHHEIQPGFPHGLCSANKEQQSYNCAFKDAALNLGLTIDSTSLMCDFELHHSTFQMLGIGVVTTTSCKQSGVKFNHLGLAEEYKSNNPTLCAEDGSSYILPPSICSHCLAWSATRTFSC